VGSGGRWRGGSVGGETGGGAGSGVGGGGHGLVGMRERAAMMGATIEVKSAPDEGTEVQVTLPLPPRRYPAKEERSA